jgi:multidrug efflux pump
VATVIDGVENDALAGWANSSRAVIVNVQRQPGANVIQVADRVKALLPQLQASLPQGLDVNVLSDRTQTVRASVEDVEFTLVLTIFLVVLVIFAFLRNLRATLIPAVTVPLSLVGTFAVMDALGFSLNNLTLMALTISTGFVVDDAIVMLENISRFIEEGDSPFEAALKGAKQIGFTIISLTVSLIAVLIPLLFMGGLIGRLFREFAITLSVAIAVSAVLSLTLTPMMGAHLLKRELPATERGAIFQASERAFEWLIALYRSTLTWVLNHQPLTLAVTVATLVLTVVLAVVIPKGFFPVQDTGLVLGVTEAGADVSFGRMTQLQGRAIGLALKDPDVESVSGFIGADGTNATTNSGRLSITLKPREQRKAGVQQVIVRLQRSLASIEGLSTFLQAAQDLQIDTRLSRTQYQFTLEDADSSELETWAPQIFEKMKGLPQLRDVASDQQDHGPVTRLTIDRDTASRLGISTQTIDDTLYDAFGQRQVSTIFTQLNLYRVILEVNPSQATDDRALDALFVKTSSGEPVPLSNLVHVEHGVAPLAINHLGQFRAVTLSFNVAPNVSLGEAVDAIDAVRAQLDPPPGMHGRYQGAASAFSESLATEPSLILAALITVYIVLGVLYESFIHPITILSTLPSAGVGAFAALLVFGGEFSIIALIGIVLLIGIVKKNAIMMIDFALEAERDHGLSPRESIFQACLLRFRPIMMTTLAALLGGLPLALGTGTGSELRRPLGISIVGGLIISQLLTLFTTPVIYLFMERLSARFKRTPKATAPVGATP